MSSCFILNESTNILVLVENLEPDVPRDYFGSYFCCHKMLLLKGDHSDMLCSRLSLV